MKKHTYEEIEKAKKVLTESGYLYPLWCKADVDGLCEQNDLDMIEDIEDFFDYVSRMHDASIGINWDSLQSYIESYLEESN